MGIETIILLVTLALWAVGFLLLGRLLRRRGGQGSLGKETAVSVIIPARNEEHNLPALLRSLASQPVKPREIIVVDDGSTDRTAELARQLGATVIASQPLPDGWRGKTWACHQGAQAATGGVLLFLDADTWFEPDGLARVLAEFGSLVEATPPSPNPSDECDPVGHKCAEGDAPTLGGAAPPPPGGAFSVGPYHAVRKPYEGLSLFFNFSMTVGTVPHRLFGQMLMVDRESYRRVGGHETVKGRILENFFLAGQFQAAGIPVRSGTGRGVFSFRMYPNGLRELIAGWIKGFAAGANRTPRGTLLLVVAWMIGLMFAPVGWLMAGDALRWGAAYLLCAAQVFWFSRQIGAFHWFSALLYPVPLIFFFAVFARSAMRSGKTVAWKGREIRAD